MTSFKVAQNRRGFWWVIINTLYQLMPQSWYHKSAQSLVNMLVLFSWHRRLSWQHYDLLRTPLISDLSAYIQKRQGEIFSFFLISRIGLLAKFKKILYMQFRATLKFRKFSGLYIANRIRPALNSPPSCYQEEERFRKLEYASSVDGLPPSYIPGTYRS